MDFDVFLANLEYYTYTKWIIITGTSLLVALIVTAIYSFLISYISFKRKTNKSVDEKVLLSLRKPIFITVFLAGIYLELYLTNTFGANLGGVQKLLVSISLIIWGFELTNIIELTIHEVAYRTGNTNHQLLKDLIPFLNPIIKITIASIIILTLLSTWGIDIRPALASAGVAGIAIAFASKDTVANLFGGISVFFDKPYKTGDVVIIQDKYRGVVIEIGMRSTRVKTWDNVLLSIPNSIMVTNAVINETGYDPKLRIRIPMGISYNSDLELAESTILEVFNTNNTVLSSPEPSVRFTNFGESAIQLEAMGYVPHPQNRVETIHHLIKEIKIALDAKDISIAYPQRDVHIVGENHFSIKP